MFDILFIESESSQGTAFLQKLHMLALPLHISSVSSTQNAWFYIKTKAHIDLIIANCDASDIDLVDVICFARSFNSRVQMILYGTTADQWRLQRIGATEFIGAEDDLDTMTETLRSLLYVIPQNLPQPSSNLQRHTSNVVWTPMVALFVHILGSPTSEQLLKCNEIFEKYTWQHFASLRFRTQRFVLHLHNDNNVFDKDELIALSKSLQNQLAEIGLSTVYIVCSRPVFSRTQCHAEISVMDYVMDYAIINDVRLSFLTPELLAQYVVSTSIHSKAEELNHAIANCNSNQAISVLNDLERSLHNGSFFALDALRSLCAEGVLAIYRKLSGQFSDEMMLDISKICSCCDWREFLPVLRKWLQRMPPMVSAGATSSHTHMIDQILHMIETEDPLKLSTESIAKALYRSPAYINHMFRQEMHISLVKYLTDYRLTQAAQQIRTTNQKIVDISKAVGYDNYSYFCQLFRKRYGVSPAKYRDEQDAASDSLH